MEPFVSVVILSLDPPGKLLEMLYNQTYKNFEIIVAREKGIVNAMNKALDLAKGEIFVRIDDDVELPENWLNEIINPFGDSRVAGVTGPTYVPKALRKNRDSIRWAENPKGILKWLYDNNKFKPGGIRKCGCVSYDSNYEERYNPISVEMFEGRFQPDYLEGTNWAMRTELIRSSGGFDPSFNGVSEWFDADIEYKIKKRGYKTIYNPRAYLFHLVQKGEHFQDRFEGFGRIKNFLRFHWRHGRHRFLNIKFYVYLTIWFSYFIWRRFKK